MGRRRWVGHDPCNRAGITALIEQLGGPAEKIEEIHYSNRCDLLERLQEALGKVEARPYSSRGRRGR